MSSDDTLLLYIKASTPENEDKFDDSQYEANGQDNLSLIICYVSYKKSIIFIQTNSNIKQTGQNVRINISSLQQMIQTHQSIYI